MKKALLLRATALIILCSMAAACGRAKAEQPDSNNPAHCFAAYSYARTIMLRGKHPDVNGAIQLSGRAMLVMRKIKQSGSEDSALETGEALLSRYSSNEQVMMSLVEGCLEAQDADPTFRTLNETGKLMTIARKIDPLCKNDPACVAGTRIDNTLLPKSPSP